MPPRKHARAVIAARLLSSAAAGGELPKDGAPAGLERKILEELIYERVRVTVDMCALVEFELDLAASIDRALHACAASPTERSDLALDYVQRAWDRLTEEVIGGLAERELAGTAAGIA